MFARQLARAATQSARAIAPRTAPRAYASTASSGTHHFGGEGVPFDWPLVLIVGVACGAGVYNGVVASYRKEYNAMHPHSTTPATA